jgi:isoleucyl-tRNA synthetase
LDPHRPQIDDVAFECPDRACGERSTRVAEVIDAWYDSGAMPFAQWGYHPDLRRGEEPFERSFPADFISEAIDQTRGWFYTLMAEGVLHFDSTAYRTVVCLGHIVDKDGRKMSKSLGNVFDPWDALERQGADALRWWMLTSGSPWASRRISHDVLDDVVRQFLLTLWNVYAFFVTYSNAEGFDPSTSAASEPRTRPVLDRWILSRLQATIALARNGLDSYDATGAGRAIQAFVDDLSNWYVRRSRRRFWNPGGEAGDTSDAAFRTLYECLVAAVTLLAPFTPFVAEALWRNLRAARDGAPESVHLADYPAVRSDLVDEDLDAGMTAARQIVELGRRVRVETKTRTRQPLGEAIVHTNADHGALDPLLPVIADELNVKRVRFAESTHAFGRWRAKPNFRALGPRLGALVKEVAAGLDADGGDLAGQLAEGESVTLTVGDSEVSLDPTDVDLSQDVLQGWGVASEGGLTVALDLELTDELRREGTARELVRLIQDARKAAGLDVSDRIVLGVEARGLVAEALASFRAVVAAETLAVEVRADGVEGGTRVDATIADVPVGVTILRA